MSPEKRAQGLTAARDFSSLTFVIVADGELQAPVIFTTVLQGNRKLLVIYLLRAQKTGNTKDIC